MTKQDESAADQQASLPVLVIENDPALRERIGALLESGGYPVVCDDSTPYIVGYMSGLRVMGIVSGSLSVDGMDLHTWLSQHFPHLVQRVVLTRSASSQKIRSKAGPAEWPFVPTPFRPRQLLSVVGKAIGKPSPTERILVSDDEEPIREIMASMLGFAGYRCRTVSGGGQALKILDSGESFDLVTSDLMNLPLDGIGFFEQMKDKYPEIPFLMITAVHDPSVEAAAFRNGVYDYLVKPFEREQLIFAVRRALEYRRLKLENRSLRAQVEELAKTPSGGGKR
jgi:DNA-binding NtrC family response regulator